jgi:hypothetical protein
MAPPDLESDRVSNSLTIGALNFDCRCRRPRQRKLYDHVHVHHFSCQQKRDLLRSSGEAFGRGCDGKMPGSRLKNSKESTLLPPQYEPTPCSG